MMALMRGTRPTSHLTRETIEAAAEYLDATVAQVYMWAGVLHPKDFVSQPRLRRELATLYRALRDHPDWGGFCPEEAEWNVLGEGSKTKILIALLFEHVAGNQYLSRTHVAASAVDETGATEAREVKTRARETA